MLPIWHAIVAVLHWLHANLAFVGISALLTAIGSGIMWPLILRKTRLEIEHLRLDTKRLELEVQKLADEKTQRETAINVADLTERIVGLAKEYTKTHINTAAAPFSEEQLCIELNEPPGVIEKALGTLKAHGRATYQSQFRTWIIKV